MFAVKFKFQRPFGSVIRWQVEDFVWEATGDAIDDYLWAKTHDDLKEGVSLIMRSCLVEEAYCEP